MRPRARADGLDQDLEVILRQPRLETPVRTRLRQRASEDAAVNGTREENHGGEGPSSPAARSVAPLRPFRGRKVGDEQEDVRAV